MFSVYLLHENYYIIQFQFQLQSNFNLKNF